MWHPLSKPVEVFLCFTVSEDSEAQQDFGKLLFSDTAHALRKLIELQLQHLCLKVIHEPGKREKFVNDSISIYSEQPSAPLAWITVVLQKKCQIHNTTRLLTIHTKLAISRQ